MKIVKASAMMLNVTGVTPLDTMRHIERCGRLCYQSGDKITLDSYDSFIRNIIGRGHESVLEHSSVTVLVTCDRGVSHEFVRHRVASYSQESTRYCNYSKGKFGSEIAVIEPLYLKPGTKGYEIWKQSCEAAEQAYFDLLAWGCTPQEARAVLPHSLKTQIAVTMNMREWRHFFKQRCSKAAHPQMREVANLILEDFINWFPSLFEDLREVAND